jgi:hypothetical protein
MIRIIPITVSVPLGTVTELEVGRLDVPIGHSYNVLEINSITVAGCRVFVYLETDRVAEFIDGVSDIDVRRKVVNWGVPAGKTLKISAINTTGGAVDLGVEIIYDDVAV